MKMATIDSSVPQGAPGLRVGGVYQRSPLTGTCYEAELECVPMSTAQEYAQGMLFERPSEAPVIVSISQRNLILAELVRGLRGCVPDLSCILVRLYGPDFNIQLPIDLLAPDVLLVHDPLAMLPTLLAAGRDNIALIQQDLRADGTERGANALSVTLLRPRPASAVMSGFEAWVQANPLLQALDGLRLENFGQVPA